MGHHQLRLACIDLEINEKGVDGCGRVVSGNVHLHASWLAARRLDRLRGYTLIITNGLPSFQRRNSAHQRAIFSRLASDAAR